MIGRETRLALQIAVSVVLLYGILWRFEAPDLPLFLYKWLAHIHATGPIAAFSTSFGNYTPPYLYLLAAVSELELTRLSTIKLISAAANLFVALAVRDLLTAFKVKAHNEAALLVLLLPTLVVNGPTLGQSDALWAGCCLFAVGAAGRDRPYAMAAWAGLGFAIKAQAVFIAPFALALVIRKRAWAAALIPPLVYLAAVLPAWLAGWPMDNLLTIYLHQYDYLDWLSTAPNPWALPQILLDDYPDWLFLIGYAATAMATALYLWRFPRAARPAALLPAALLSAILIPYLMPKMHERYFLLADLLVFCLAYVDRRGVPIMIAVQLGSLCSLGAYFFAWLPLNIVGAVFMAAALLLLLRLMQHGQGDQRRDGQAVGAGITGEAAGHRQQA